MSGADVQAEHLVRESAVELQALNAMNELYSFATLLATPIELVELLAGHLISEGYETPSIQRASITQNEQIGFVVSYHGQLLQKRSTSYCYFFMRCMQPSRTPCRRGCQNTANFEIRKCPAGRYS